jgi:hypothetical protein
LSPRQRVHEVALGTLDRAPPVPAVTLDQLIEYHGELDVEGFEDNALAGLSRPVRALSFEFTIIGRSVAARCHELGPYRVNAAFGETQCLVFSLTGRCRKAQPDRTNSGDI